MNLVRITAAAALALVCTSAFAQSGSDIEGTWITEGGHATFEVSLCDDGTQLCATLVSLSEDTVAPILEPLVGEQIISGVKPAGENKWEGVLILSGTEVSIPWRVEAPGTITLVDPDRVEAEGCLLGECRTITLERADS